MARLVSFFVLFGALAYASALPRANVTVETSSEVQVNPIASILSHRLVDIVSQKLTSLARHFQLKIRVARLVASLYTNENLLLLRDLIGQGVRFANFALKFIPKSTNEPGFEWVLIITELFRTSNATEELIGMFLGSPPVSTSAPLGELPPEKPENQSIFYNAAAGTGNPEFNELKSMRQSRQVKQEYQDGDGFQEIYSDYNVQRIKALDKLIRANRK